jgi:putative membrane protein
MMGFGFVVAKFGILLREISRFQGIAPPKPSELSHGFGTLLIVVGVTVTLCATGNPIRTIRVLVRNEPLRFGQWPLGIVVALLLALFWILASTYLLSGMADMGT